MGSCLEICNECLNVTALCVDICCCCGHVHRIVEQHGRILGLDDELERHQKALMNLFHNTASSGEMRRLRDDFAEFRMRTEDDTTAALARFQRYAVDQHDLTLQQRMTREDGIRDWCISLQDRVTELERKEMEREQASHL